MSQRTNITFTDEMHKAIDRLSEKTGAPLAHIVREAVAQYLEKEERIKIENIHPIRGGYRGRDK